MDLDVSSGKSYSNVTEQDLIETFQRDFDSQDYIILFQSGQVFLQTAMDRDGFVLEYREGSKDKHFESARKLSQEEVLLVFLRYLKQEPGWKNAIEWQPLSVKPWWKFW